MEFPGCLPKIVSKCWKRSSVISPVYCGRLQLFLNRVAFYIKNRPNLYASPLPDNNTPGEPDQALAVGNSQLALVTDSPEAVVQVPDATRTCDKFTKTR
jgi:hypothetical protein